MTSPIRRLAIRSALSSVLVHSAAGRDASWPFATCENAHATAMTVMTNHARRVTSHLVPGWPGRSSRPKFTARNRPRARAGRSALGVQSGLRRPQTAPIERGWGPAPHATIRFDSQSDRDDARLVTLAFRFQPILEVVAIMTIVFAVNLERAPGNLLVR